MSDLENELKTLRGDDDTGEPDAVATGKRPGDYSPDEAIKFLNSRYAWIESLGRIAVATEDGTTSYQRVDTFKTTHDNRCVTVSDDKRHPLGTWWLKSPRRESYSKVGLYAPPMVAPARTLNLWRGFAVEPKAGDWSKMRDHIHDVIASGNKELADYVLCWLAWAFQNPGARAEASLVLRGTEGTGKGILGNNVSRIFGPHAVHVTDPEQFVTGRFNVHMAGCVFLFADECWWPGDRKFEGKLKGMITEPTLRVEPKGIDSYDTPNVLHVLISSNDEWVVPAGKDARRFVVCDVSKVHMGDAAYFKALAYEMDHGGREAMLHDLLAAELGDWHPRQIVMTQGLLDQKEKTLSPEAEWTLAIVRDLDLPCGELIARDASWIPTSEIAPHARAAVPRGNWTSERIKEALRSIGAQPKRGNGGVRGWTFPAPAEARTAWCAKYYQRAWPDSPTAW